MEDVLDVRGKNLQNRFDERGRSLPLSSIGLSSVPLRAFWTG